MRQKLYLILGLMVILALSACTVAPPAPVPFTAAPLPTETAVLPGTGGTAAPATAEVTLPPVETTAMTTEMPAATETSVMVTPVVPTEAVTLPPLATSPVTTETALPTVASTSAAGTAPASSAGLSSCLAGTWQLNGNDQYLLSLLPSILPAPVAQMGNLSKSGQSGQVVYVFGSDGSLNVNAQNFQARYAVQINNLSTELVLGMNGQASARYALQGDLLNVSQPKYDQMVFSGSLGGVTVSSSQLNQFIPLVNGSFNAARAQCSGNQLTMQIQGMPSAAPQISFSRVSP